MSSYCCQPSKPEMTDKERQAVATKSICDSVAEKMMTGENESLQERRKEHNFCSYCKGPILNGYHLNGMCNAEQQSEITELHLRNEFEGRMRDAIGRGAQMEELSEIFDQEVKRRRGDKAENVFQKSIKESAEKFQALEYFSERAIKRVAACETEVRDTRRDMNAALSEIQAEYKKMILDVQERIDCFSDEPIWKNLLKRLDEFEGRLYLCEKVYAFKKDMVFPPPNVEQFQYSKGIPFQCPNCDGEGLRENIHPVNEKHYPERYLPCISCEGRGIVWG